VMAGPVSRFRVDNRRLGDDLDPVVECHTENEFWQLVVAVPAAVNDRGRERRRVIDVSLSAARAPGGLTIRNSGGALQCSLDAGLHVANKCMARNNKKETFWLRYMCVSHIGSRFGTERWLRCPQPFILTCLHEPTYRASFSRSWTFCSARRGCRHRVSIRQQDLCLLSEWTS
jgi:hypothetical protein